MTGPPPAPDASPSTAAPGGSPVSAADPAQRSVPGLAEALALPGAQELLDIALAIRFGRRNGRVDVTASAELGVGVRTVRRWLQPRPGQATVPRRSLGPLLQALRPTDATRRREELEIAQAEDALRRLRAGARRGDTAQWHNTRWTEPHTLSLIEMRELGVRRLAVTAHDDEVLLRRARRGGRVVEEVTVRSRFAATLVRAAVLREVDGWRIDGAPQVLGKGRTQVWLTVGSHPPVQQVAQRRFRTVQ